MSKLQTDNSHLEAKIQVRIDALSGIDFPKILECYAGRGIIWDSIKTRLKKEIKITKIEKEKFKSPKMALPGDCLKYLKSINLDSFDIIDLDAYGIPFDQMETLFNRNYKGRVIVTSIQSMHGGIPKKLAQINGISDKIRRAAPSLINSKFVEFISSYLYNHNIKSVRGITCGRKHYFWYYGGNGNVSNLRTERKSA